MRDPTEKATLNDYQFKYRDTVVVYNAVALL
jgi:hypothetical protein